MHSNSQQGSLTKDCLGISTEIPASEKPHLPTRKLDRRLFITCSTSRWFTSGIKLNKSFHALLRLEFEPGVRHYSHSAWRMGRLARYRRVKVQRQKIPSAGPSLPFPAGKAKLWEPIPTSHKTFANRPFDLQHSKHSSSRVHITAPPQMDSSLLAAFEAPKTELQMLP